MKHINNWNLVDISCYKIVGAYTHEVPSERKIFDTLVTSEVQWGRRVSIVSQIYFIKKGDLELTFKLSEQLMEDKEDLMHKAMGWMLRETGKKSMSALNEFLDKWADSMPRTSL